MGSKRVVLVLPGGGMRGVFTQGVLETLLPCIPADSIAGFYAVSSGAPTAAYAATRQWDAGRRIWTEHVPSSNIFRWRNLVPMCFGSNGHCVLQLETLRRIFTEVEPLDVAALQTLPWQVQIGVTDAETGEGQLRDLRYEPDPMGLILASMALPGVHPPFPLKDRLLFDGSIAQPIPFGNLERMHDEYHPVVILTRPKQHRKNKLGFFERALVWRTLQGFPVARAATYGQAERENHALAFLLEEERKGHCTVIAPNKDLPVTRYGGDPYDFYTAYCLGCEAADAARETLKGLLG